MTDRPTKVIVDCSTGETTIEELTDEEIAEREVMAAQAELEQAERMAEEQRIADLKASAQAKLAALGLTEDEITALGA
jgi:hypothetical protein